MIRIFLGFMSARVVSQAINFISSYLLITNLPVGILGQYSARIEFFLLVYSVLEIVLRQHYIVNLSKNKRYLSDGSVYLLLLVGILWTVWMTIFSLSNWIFIGAVFNLLFIPFLADMIVEERVKVIAVREIAISILKLCLFGTLILFNSYNIYLYVLYFYIILLVNILVFRKYLGQIIVPKINSSYIKSFPILLVLLISLNSLEGRFEIVAVNNDDIIGEFSKYFRLLLPLTLLNGPISNTILPHFSKSIVTRNYIHKLGLGSSLAGIVLASIVYLGVQMVPQLSLVFTNNLNLLIFLLVLPIYFALNIYTNSLMSSKRYLVLSIATGMSLAIKFMIFNLFELSTFMLIVTFVVGSFVMLLISLCFVSIRSYTLQ